MKQISLIILFIVVSLTVSAQDFSIGHTTVTFNDPLRTGGFGSGAGPGRQIQTEVYFPATAEGEDGEFAPGRFPVVIFGHGYLMPWEIYRNIWEALVPRGYILVFPRTEPGFTSIHAEFAADIALCARRMIEAGAANTGFFSGKVSEKAAFAGHSMGGGAAILAAADNEYVTTVIGLAPLETDPQASVAALSVVRPSLIFSGSQDAVTVPSIHHRPVYENLGSPCKYFISINGGAHCYFANPYAGCDLGEMLLSSGISISRNDQHAILNDYLIKWLGYHLKDDVKAGTDFTDLIRTDWRITYREDCFLSVEQFAREDQAAVRIMPNPVREVLFIYDPSPEMNYDYQIADITGRVILQGKVDERDKTVPVMSLPGGIYLLSLKNSSGACYFRVLVTDH
jgi:dienelactone hydrolase